MVNTALVAGDNGVYIVSPSATLTGLGLLSNDVEPDWNTTLTIELVGGGPDKGILDLHPSNGTFFYDPDDKETGVDSFQYRLWDGTEHSNVATVHLRINQAPTAIEDGPYRVAPNGSYQAPAGTLFANDSDPEGDAKEKPQEAQGHSAAEDSAQLGP